jgi:hypothetical protein
MSGATVVEPFITRETVAVDTPAAAATVETVTRPPRAAVPTVDLLIAVIATKALSRGADTIRLCWLTVGRLVARAAMWNSDAFDICPANPWRSRARSRT